METILVTKVKLISDHRREVINHLSNKIDLNNYLLCKHVPNKNPLH